MRLLLAAVLLAAAPHVVAQRQLFNGKDLAGWRGLDFWSVRDGAITGQTTKEHPTKGNTFLVWEGEVADFELTLRYRIVDLNGKSDAFGNSGIQYRSKVVDEKAFVVAGYQGDFECGKTYSGILYEEKGRGILAKRGEKVVIHEGKDPKKPRIEVVGEVGKSAEIQAAIRPADWNDYRIVARGGHLQHFINGVQTVDVTDETAAGARKGVLALQLHAGTAMTVQFKDIVLKDLK
ncbi:MAG: 3-keto-disaccharide hydrolase [Opitutales bacterium]